MLIDQLQRKLLECPALAPATAKLEAGEDASIGLVASVRPFLVACAFARRPRPTLVVVSGEEAAERFANGVASFIGCEQVLVLPERRDLPWSDAAVDYKALGQRTRAIGLLAAGRPVVVCASARALLRRVAPAGSGFFSPLVITVGGGVVDGATGQLLEYEELAGALLERGYQHLEELDGPGSFCIHGDSVDIFGSGMTSPVRAEFWGDEVDGLRRVVASTGQTIGALDSVEIWPAREFGVSKRGAQRAARELQDRAATDKQVAEDLAKLEAGVSFPGMERYLPAVCKEPAIPVAHAAAQTLVVLAEPRSLFDDASRRYDELSASASNAGVRPGDLSGLFCPPAKLDFGTQQRLTLQSMMRVGAGVDVELPIQRPSFQGREERLVSTCAALADSRYSALFCVADRKARKDMEMLFTDSGLSYVERLEGSTEPLRQDLLNISELDLPTGFIIPDARLALLSIGDLSARSSRRPARRRVDITELSFPFKPGDYVVHASHGIALFKDIVRQEVDGLERDYLLLAYAEGDKLFVPVEQIDRVTRYVGPDGSSPRLTRLHTADWSRAMGKARKSAKKLAFDLVDLYARRSTVKGYRYSPDGEFMVQMEGLFPYEETPDQASAIAEVKADMESEKPMDRLICGDVGFGKTEVAMRAAFKAITDHRQVMILCPTTILAQQHFSTFSDRFSPFGVRVEVLSRFRSQAQQKAALEGFAKGEVDVLVGTHRLLSRDVNPKELGLIIIDEEQRFGVGHKEQLKNLRESVDVLTLSATPIPRTLQMSLSGVRDMSLITTPPTNRRPVKVHVGEWDEDLIGEAIRREIQRGGQVYYVSNRVRTIEDAEESVRAAVPEARIGVAHGQMAPSMVEDMMERFNGGEIDVLVATTIVESGLDNPHANTLIIEDSQRLGLAQLYQLKGRVGRSQRQAYAYFLFPSNQPLTEEATQRLEAIGEFTELGSGMRVAMKDLEIRGAGTLMGAEQSGNMSAVGFDLFASLLAEAVSEARGEDKLAHPEIHVDVAADFLIPAEYMEDGGERVLYYRRLAAAVTVEDVDDIAAKMRSAYGALPQPAANICNRARAKTLCQTIGATSVAQVGGKLVIGEVSKTVQAVINASPEAKALITRHRGIYVSGIKVYRIPVGKGEPVLDIAVDLLRAMAGAVEAAQDEGRG